MTQADEIIELLKKNLTLSNIELANLTGFPRPSVRRNTGTLTKQGILIRVKKGIYQLNTNIFYRHLISAGFYKDGNLEQMYAVTYKNDNIEILDQLVRALIQKAEDSNHGSIPMIRIGKKAQTSDDFNYSIDKIPIQEINKMAIYPMIEAGLD